MTSLTARLTALPPGTLRRGVLAGTAWGLAMGIALPVLGLFDCGVICLSDVTLTSVVSITAGIPLFGALVAVMPRRESR